MGLYTVDRIKNQNKSYDNLRGIYKKPRETTNKEGTVKFKEPKWNDR